MQKSLFLKFTTLLLLVSLLIACKDDKPEILSPTQILASTAWSTTDAKNEKGQKIPLTDPSVSNFVGYSYFETSGAFSIFSLDNTPKMRGTWSIPADGKTRTLVTPTFTRTVEITVLTTAEFTYRIYPNVNDKSKYLDIVHTPTQHTKPAYLSPSEILASTKWITSDAKNEKGEKVPLTDPNVVTRVGYSTFNMDGNFSIFDLQNAPRVSGTWSISADGKTRTLVTPNFTATVEITVLTKSEFTYRIYPVASNTSIFLDIIHIPVKEVIK